MTLAAMEQQRDDNSSLGPIINDIRAFLREFFQPKFNHVRLEANHAAHRPARAGLGRRHEVLWFQEPLKLITDILIEDS